ncbi:uncharacterized protein LOC8028235 [Ixodes scapularis]|uniref:uncharacterized protein LOC8028235 n=1 Tax=Ixodes scapularis TaxID=6945 RepID=UPI001A9D24F3|nr:uncharacterized protein LOC8028235 [Ixodes scapularis]
MTFIAVFILGASFFLESTSATDTSCFNLTISNVLGIGECLGTAGNVCTEDTDGVAGLVSALLVCAVNGISDLNLGSQLYLIEGALTFLLERAGLGLLADAIQGLCKLSLLDCSGFSLDNQAICAEPIVLNFPTALGLGKCVGDMAEVCIEGNPATDTLVKSIFDFLTCTVENVFSYNVGSLLTDLVCSLLNIILRDLGQLSGPFQVVVNTIKTVLGLRC